MWRILRATPDRLGLLLLDPVDFLIKKALNLRIRSVIGRSNNHLTIAIHDNRDGFPVTADNLFVFVLGRQFWRLI
jgi:hypothetical protein